MVSLETMLKGKYGRLDIMKTVIKMGSSYHEQYRCLWKDCRHIQNV